MKLLVATHKEKVFIHNSIVKGIQVGAANTETIIDPSYYLDSSGTNISAKNPNYNELTALYWMWKNLRDEDVLGLMHYRRYFNFHENPFSFKPRSKRSVDANHELVKKNREQDGVISRRVHKWLAAHDVVVPYFLELALNDKVTTVQEDYYHHHREDDWNETMKIVVEKYPEYAQSIEKYLVNDNKLYWGNLFIARYEFVDTYCKWLFSIFDELEKRITISSDPYQRRVFGFLSERLFTLYIRHNNLKLKKLSTLFIEEMFEKYKPIEGGGALNKG